MGVVLLSQVGPQREEVKGKESKAGSEIKVHHVDYLRSLFLCGRRWYLGQRSLPWLTLSLPLEDVSRGCHTSPQTSPPVTQASPWIHALPSSPSTSSLHGQLWAHSQSHGVLEPDHGFLFKKEYMQKTWATESGETLILVLPSMFVTPKLHIHFEKLFICTCTHQYFVFLLTNTSSHRPSWI